MRFLTYCLISCLACGGQSRPAAPFDQPGANLPSQKIGPNDLLSLSVYDSPELSRTVRVNGDGVIRVPLLEGGIQLKGKLPAEAEQLIAGALVKGGLLVNPMVTVSVAEYASRPINVAGAVRNPMTFQATGPTKLLDALSKAGGLSENAASEILVSYPAAEQTESPRVLRISIKELFHAGRPELNVALHGGEEISVPAAGRVYILGNVKKPGAFPLRDASESSVLEILALAEGLTPFPAKDAYIYRLQADGSRKEIPVKLDAILRRQSSDVPMVPDDILHIPDNKGRRLGMAALERVLMFGSTAGATALIYGH